MEEGHIAPQQECECLQDICSDIPRAAAPSHIGVGATSSRFESVGGAKNDDGFEGLVNLEVAKTCRHNDDTTTKENASKRMRSMAGSVYPLHETASEYAAFFGHGKCEYATISMNGPPKYTLYYWPIPARGVFIRSLLAFTNTPFEEAPMEEVTRIYAQPPHKQPVPFRAPPILVDHEASDFAVSQLVAIVHYVATKEGLMPEDLTKQSLALKIVCDANDVLAEIWRANGDITKNGEYVMWDQLAWDTFRNGRFIRWLQQFEALADRFGCTLASGFVLGTPSATLADLTCWSLWATMARCLPELRKPIYEHAPILMALCDRLERNSGLTTLVAKERKVWGELYCGGMIEKSIRQMLTASRNGRGARGEDQAGTDDAGM
eukprot:TRINITY_DN82651_c0_g1_i1.p1 TRINITY_DN82651_c0_g1~~TRINITY_DN82651_c0_g1_i1.p1  ORF type:complete len:378 (-),score=36.58 TRINITY_DN82651_c0_g1_i1:9-1142(-)